MKCKGLNSPDFIDLIHLQTLNNPYSSSLATSASGSSSSVWSDASSQNSDDTSISAPLSDSDSCESYPFSARQIPSQTSSSACDSVTRTKWIKHQSSQVQPQVEAPAELRQNPRRTSSSSVSRPPTLVRQGDRKVNFVDNLVGKI